MALIIYGESGTVAVYHEKLSSAFTKEASLFVIQYLGKGPATAEELTNACKEAGMCPDDDRAFGAVYARLSHKGVIHKVGHALRAKGHYTTGGNIWALRQVH
jgi:hypothetical protein